MVQAWAFLLARRERLRHNDWILAMQRTDRPGETRYVELGSREQPARASRVRAGWSCIRPEAQRVLRRGTKSSQGPGPGMAESGPPAAQDCKDLGCLDRKIKSGPAAVPTQDDGGGDDSTIVSAHPRV